VNRGTLIFRPGKDPDVGRWYLDLGAKPWTSDLGLEAFQRRDQKPAVRKWREAFYAARLRNNAGAARPKEAGPETVDAYFLRWVAERERKGLRTTKSDRQRYGKDVAPMIGHLPVKAVTRRDLEGLVERLDALTRERPRFCGKTARNIWGLASKLFKDAASSKTLGLRVRDDNPARDVAPPDKGTEREGAYLYPAEFLALVTCPRVPVRWKRLIAVSHYLGVRRGELEALDCPRWTSRTATSRSIKRSTRTPAS